MGDWQQRVIDEKAEIDVRIKRLGSFLFSGQFHRELSELEQRRLVRQYDAMTTYSDCLNQRIIHF